MDWGQALLEFVVQTVLGLGVIFALYGLFRLRCHLKGSDYRHWSWAFQIFGFPLALGISIGLKEPILNWLC